MRHGVAGIGTLARCDVCRRTSPWEGWRPPPAPHRTDDFHARDQLLVAGEAALGLHRRSARTDRTGGRRARDRRADRLAPRRGRWRGGVQSRLHALERGTRRSDRRTTPRSRDDGGRAHAHAAAHALGRLVQPVQRALPGARGIGGRDPDTRMDLGAGRAGHDGIRLALSRRRRRACGTPRSACGRHACRLAPLRHVARVRAGGDVHRLLHPARPPGARDARPGPRRSARGGCAG